MPAGILTQRDIVVAVVARGLDPAKFTVADIMSEHIVLARESDDVLETIEKMRQEGVRRMPVVNDRNVLTGIISLDDLLLAVAQELAGLAGLPPDARKNERGFRN